MPYTIASIALYMNKPNEEIILNIKPRPSENLEISIPIDNDNELVKNKPYFLLLYRPNGALNQSVVTKYLLQYT